MLYSEENVRVGPSAHGLGVFAVCLMAEDGYIGPIEGTVIDDPDYESNYCMELGGDLAMEPAFPFRYVNHSCHPNFALVQIPVEYGDQNVPELWLEVRSPITPGEQLTIDYGWPAGQAEPCLCGCPDCRGWIVAAGEVDRLALEGRETQRDKMSKVECSNVE